MRKYLFEKSICLKHNDSWGINWRPHFQNRLIKVTFLTIIAYRDDTMLQWGTTFLLNKRKYQKCTKLRYVAIEVKLENFHASIILPCSYKTKMVIVWRSCRSKRGMEIWNYISMADFPLIGMFTECRPRLKLHVHIAWVVYSFKICQFFWRLVN